jgi:hypothetical protein
MNCQAAQSVFRAPAEKGSTPGLLSRGTKTVGRSMGIVFHAAIQLSDQPSELIGRNVQMNNLAYP